MVRRVARRRLGSRASLAGWPAAAAVAGTAGAGRARADSVTRSPSASRISWSRSISGISLESPQLATEFGSKAGDDRWDDESERALAATRRGEPP